MFGISSFMWVKTVDPDQEPADQSLHGFQKWHKVTNTIVISRNMVNAKMTSSSIILPTHMHEGINDNFRVLVQLNPDLSFLKTVYIQISWLLMKPTDQDQHCFPIYDRKYMLTTGMLQIDRIKMGIYYVLYFIYTKFIKSK